VADGMVVTLGVNGALSALTTDGKKVWRINDTGSVVVPMFHTSSSPLILDKMVIAQFGNEQKGGVAAYDLASGNEKWKWTDEGTAYASPTLMTADGTKMLVVETSKSVVALSPADKKVLWQVPFAGPGRLDYNAATPVVEGYNVYFSGVARGTKAIKIEKKGDGFATTPVWDTGKDLAAKFNTPIVKDGVVYGLTVGNVLFAVSAETGKKLWDNPLPGGGGRDSGYGSVLDAGSVLMALTPTGPLLVFAPSDKEYKELASYKVGTGTYSVPVVSGSRIYIKDGTDKGGSLTCWTVD